MLYLLFLLIIIIIILFLFLKTHLHLLLENQTWMKQLFDISVMPPVGQLYQRPKDCAQVLLNGETTSGLYTVYIGGEESQPIQVFCDMSTDGGGWMVSESKPAGRQLVEAEEPYFTWDMS